MLEQPKAYQYCLGENLEDVTMVNQQGKIHELELAWLAGFMDGEGSVCMNKVNCGRTHIDGTPMDNRVPRITIANTHEATFNKVAQILDRLGLPYHISWRNPKNSRWQRSWHISVQGMKRFLRWAEVFEPLVFVKKEQFKVAREYCQSRMSHSRLDKLTDTEKGLIARFTTREIPQRLNALKN